MYKIYGGAKGTRKIGEASSVEGAEDVANNRRAGAVSIIRKSRRFYSRIVAR